jgi:hypothetical protein
MLLSFFLNKKMIATDKSGNQLIFIIKLNDEHYALTDKYGNKGNIYLSTDDYIWGLGISHKFKIGSYDVLFDLRKDMIGKYLLEEEKQMTNYIYNIIYTKEMLHQNDIMHYIVDILCDIIPKRHYMANTDLLGNCESI